MKEIKIGTVGTAVTQTSVAHTAASVGNPGVEVLGTAALIIFFEDAAHNCLAPYFEDGEGSLGTVVNIQHLGAALAGAEITATATLLKKDGRKLDFLVEVHNGDTLLMKGEHSRAVVNLERFLSSVK